MPFLYLRILIVLEIMKNTFQIFTSKWIFSTAGESFQWKIREIELPIRLSKVIGWYNLFLFMQGVVQEPFYTLIHVDFIYWIFYDEFLRWFYQSSAATVTVMKIFTKNGISRFFCKFFVTIACMIKSLSDLLLCKVRMNIRSDSWPSTNECMYFFSLLNSNVLMITCFN